MDDTIFHSDNLTEQELQDIKLWMFRENIRLRAEKKELDELYNKFLEEKKQFEKESNAIAMKLESEKIRLTSDQNLFDKKLEILQNAFRQLDLDRKQLDKERKVFEADRIYQEDCQNDFDIDSVFFIGINNVLALKKRYRDLSKIFHPDNLCGNQEIFQTIKKEYECLYAYYRNGK